MRFIKEQIIPQKMDCVQCLEAEPGALRKRSWKGVKDYIRNRITALRSRRQRRDPAASASSKTKKQRAAPTRRKGGGDEAAQQFNSQGEAPLYMLASRMLNTVLVLKRTYLL